MPRTKAAILPKYKIATHETFDLLMLRSDLREQSQKIPPDDKVFVHFATELYPFIAALLDPVPTLDELYRYSPKALDGLYLNVRRAVPTWFDDTEYTEESVTFSDGKKITVRSKRPSVILRLVALQVEAESKPPLNNARREFFRFMYYPSVAGCSVGDVPSEEYARSIMSTDDLLLWDAAARRQVPTWFDSMETVAALVLSPEQQKAEEKKSVMPE